jgi:hypothetical protein
MRVQAGHDWNAATLRIQILPASFGKSARIHFSSGTLPVNQSRPVRREQHGPALTWL